MFRLASGGRNEYDVANCWTEPACEGAHRLSGLARGAARPHGEVQHVRRQYHYGGDHQMWRHIENQSQALHELSKEIHVISHEMTMQRLNAPKRMRREPYVEDYHDG